MEKKCEPGLGMYLNEVENEAREKEDCGEVDRENVLAILTVFDESVRTNEMI